MKKFIAILLVLTLALTAFAGCGSKSKLGDIGTTEEIVNKLNEDGKVEYRVGVNKLEIVKEGWAVSSFTGLTDDEFTKYVEEGYVSEAMIGSQAHSMVLLKLKNKADSKTVAEIMDSKIDRRKWICVQADKSYTNTSDEYVLFIMSDTETCDNVGKAFETLAGSFGTATVTTGNPAEKGGIA